AAIADENRLLDASHSYVPDGAIRSNVRSNSFRRHLFALLTLQMGCGLLGDVGRFLADVERTTEGRDLCQSVDVRRHRIALPHRDLVTGEDFALGRPLFGYIERRH